MRSTAIIIFMLIASAGIAAGLEDVYTLDTVSGTNTVYFNKTYDTNYINSVTVTTYSSNVYYQYMTIQTQSPLPGPAVLIRANVTRQAGMNADFGNIEFIDGDGNILSYYAAESTWLFNESRRIFYIKTPIINGSTLMMRWGENVTNQSNSSIIQYIYNVSGSPETFTNSSWFNFSGRIPNNIYNYQLNALDAGLYHRTINTSNTIDPLSLFCFYADPSNSIDRNILNVGGRNGSNYLIRTLPTGGYPGGYNVDQANISSNSNSGYYMPEISIKSGGGKTSLDLWFTKNNSSVNISSISQEYIPPESYYQYVTNFDRRMSRAGEYNNHTSIKYMYLYHSAPHEVTFSDVMTESAEETITQTIETVADQLIDRISFNSSVLGVSNVIVDFDPYVLPLTDNNTTQTENIQLSYFANPALTEADFKISLDATDDLIFASGAGNNGIFNASIPTDILGAGYFQHAVYWALKYTNGSWSPWYYLNIQEMAPPASNISINVFNESNPTSQINVTVNLSNATHFISKSGKSISFDETQITEGQYLAQVTAPGFLPRYYVVNAPGAYDFYLANESIDYAIVNFQLIDNTGFFKPSSTKLIVKSNSGVGELLISSRFFNVAGESSLPLLVGSYYTLTLQNESGFEKSLGFLIPTTSETIRLIVGDIINTELDPYGNFSYTIEKNPENISLTWIGANLTPINLTITSLNGNTEPFYFSTRAPSGSTVYLIPDQNLTYRIEFSANAGGKTISEVLYYSPTKKIIDTSSISETAQNAICIFLLLVLSLIVSPLNVKVGALLVVGTATAMFAMGFLHIAFVIVAWIVFVGFAAIFMNPFVR